MAALFRPHRIAGAALYAPDYGEVGVTANSSQTMGAFVGAAAAAVVVAASSAVAMGAFVGASSASVGVAANSSVSMGEFTSLATATTDINANAAIAMGAFASSSQAEVTGTAIDPGEPVTVEEAKLAARFEGDELDAYIAGAISAARAQAEQITGRVYRRRVFRFEMSSWPASGQSFSVHAPDLCEITYWGANGWQQLSPSAFEFAGMGGGAEIAPALGAAWPELAPKALGARVRVDFTAGPTDRAEVDAAVKLYIKAQVAAWLNSPEAVADKDLQPSPLIARLLDAERLWC
ncbi:head-tail connector protein [Roseateles asaccharophilus]|uniref:PhiE125 gp8 family phage protein n=1 Tax=Roseateles asaccharophilus TaxID=582607 RepID=A0ABU2A3Z7_9BURK|nr:head-tail connector protein [Roseateles asaccharophilus]MDR7331760.1 putative phiE125 gp8 family phage protein [Roseateles asaccharophilus]